MLKTKFRYGIIINREFIKISQLIFIFYIPIERVVLIMPKKKVNKIEQNYSKFIKMTPDEMEKYKENINNEIASLEEHLTNKAKEIEGREATIDLTTDQDRKYVLAAQKETAEQELEDLYYRRQKQQKALKEVENYEKNKDKIQKIVGYKEKLKTQREKFKTDAQTLALDLQNKKEEKAQIEEKLKNSEELTNPEYNSLMIQKEKVEKEIEQKERKLEQLNKKIISLNGSVSKCDLVWKNLMLGKTWDEIHVKAVEMNKTKNKKYVPTQEEMEAKQSLVNVLAQIRDKKQAEIEQNPTIRERATDAIKDKAMTKYDNLASKHPILAKFRDAFTKLRNKFTKNKKEEVEQEGQEVASAPRDEFVDKLRVMVDAEYKEQVKAEKVKQEAQKHAVKSTNQNERQ